MAEEPKIYTVGWICALTSEYIAARNFLDEKYEDAVPSQGDNNTYTLGRMGSHNVVIVCLPRRKTGNVSAASVASDMLRSFESIRFGLMVGIGGGASTNDNDIRLGDVVVSSPDRQVGGVLHYKFGREIQNRGFELTGSLASPPPILLSALNQLSAQHVEEGHPIAESIEQMVTHNKNLRQHFQRPPPEKDRLYKEDYVHTDNMRADEKSQLVVRQPRSRKHHDPAIHYGLIASADQVMKDAHTRDKLAKEQGILYFEIEAASLMDRFACVQSYAAATAAAYAKELLAVISGDKVNKMVPMSGDKHHENVLKAVVPALKSSIDGLLKRVDTFGTSADEQKETLANTSTALDKIHKGLSMLNDASSDYKEKLNTLNEKHAGRESIEQVSDQLKRIQSSVEDFAKALETLTQRINVKQEESPSRDWESLSDKAKEQKLDLEEMASITRGAIKGSHEIAGKLGVSQKVTNKLGGVGDLMGGVSKVGKFVKRLRGDKSQQRPPVSAGPGTPVKMQMPLKPSLISETDNTEQKPPLLNEWRAPSNGKVNDTKTFYETLQSVHNNGSIAPPSPASQGNPIRSFDPSNALYNHRTTNPSRPSTSDPGTTHSPVSSTSSSNKGPALPKPPAPPKPPKPEAWVRRGSNQ